MALNKMNFLLLQRFTEKIDNINKHKYGKEKF